MSPVSLFVAAAVLSVVDDETKKILVKYEIPIVFLLPFRQYHLDLLMVRDLYSNSNINRQK